MTITEAANHLDISRQATHKAIKKEKWQVYEAGLIILLRETDIYEYRDIRYRTRLAIKLGWSKEFQGDSLYRDSDIDIACPKCGKFAIEWPPILSEYYLCINGHKGKEEII